jgi:hypothetical protein
MHKAQFNYLSDDDDRVEIYFFEENVDFQGKRLLFMWPTTKKWHPIERDYIWQYDVTRDVDMKLHRPRTKMPVFSMHEKLLDVVIDTKIDVAG